MRGSLAKLQDYLLEMGISVDETVLEQLLAHLEMVRCANEQINLTRIVEGDESLVKHIVDSALFAKLAMSLADDGQSTNLCSLRFVDVGTGAGYPGIPFALITHMRGTLIDSVKKKVVVANDIVHRLDLHDMLDVQCIRVEELARQRHNEFDVVIARAVAETAVLQEYARPLLIDGGYLIISKGQMNDDEFEHAEKVTPHLGYELVSRETYELPQEFGQRLLLAYKVNEDSKIKLPRRDGVARKRPLWNVI